MDKKIKRKWVRALRSRKYKRGEGQLYLAPEFGTGKGQHCCLGVLIRCMYPDLKPPASLVCYSAFSGKKRTGTMPAASILRRAGISIGKAHSLASLNDSGHTFSFIAKYIEAEL